jgi:hypothetical protein
MKTALKVMFINIAACALLAFFGIMADGFQRPDDFLIWFGLICLAAAVLDLIVAVILFITGPAQYNVAKGFLLSCGVLVLIGFASCSFTTISFH